MKETPGVWEYLRQSAARATQEYFAPFTASKARSIADAVVTQAHEGAENTAPAEDRWKPVLSDVEFKMVQAIRTAGTETSAPRRNLKATLDYYRNLVHSSVEEDVGVSHAEASESPRPSFNPTFSSRRSNAPPSHPAASPLDR